MDAGKNHWEEVAGFIREQRSNEANFETLYAKWQGEEKESTDESYRQQLKEAGDKAEAYKAIKESGATGWPEFEKFVSAFEKAVLGRLSDNK